VKILVERLSIVSDFDLYSPHSEPSVE